MPDCSATVNMDPCAPYHADACEVSLAADRNSGEGSQMQEEQVPASEPLEKKREKNGEDEEDNEQNSQVPFAAPVSEIFSILG